jgi:hypothetical protein
MFPNGHHTLKLPPIDHRTVDKSPLRPIHTHSLAAKRSIVPLRPAMNLIALRHRPSTKTENNGDGIPPSPPSLNQNQFQNVHSLFANEKTRPITTVLIRVIRANRC